MKKILFLIILALPLFSIGQKISNDTLYIDNNIIVKGQFINLGEGSNMATRDFNFIYTAPSLLVHESIKLGSGYMNQKMLVKEIKMHKSKRTGDKYYLILGGGNIVNYLCDIVPAIKTKEVVL